MRLLRVLLRKTRTATTLPPRRLWAITRAWWVLTWVHVSLYALPYRFWKNRLNAALNDDGEQALDPAAALVCRQLARDIATAVRNHFLSINCLGKSLALHTLCRRAGYATRLMIGIRRTHGYIEGHAWLEADGSILNDTQAATKEFTRLGYLPVPQPTFSP